MPPIHRDEFVIGRGCSDAVDFKSAAASNLAIFHFLPVDL